MCGTVNQPWVVAPSGVLGSYGVPFALGAPGPLGTVVVGVPRCVPVSPGTQGWSGYCVPLHGCTDAQGRAFVPAPV